KSPKCLGGNLGDFGGFCKGLDLGITRNPKKKPKPNTLDSRFRGNDGGGWRCRLKPDKAFDAV
ncbi:hypothetical protein, partial [Neisseria viridiae]|uniref:hypothetical protein n=1 Tax=Neisseria viridiae TaxID=2830648 RepID=UPI00272D8D08